jgi:hypothetical protein
MAPHEQVGGHAAMRQLLPLLLPKEHVGIANNQEAILRRSAWCNAACQHNLGPAFYVFLQDGGSWRLLPSRDQEILEEAYRQNLAFYLARESVLTELIGLLKAAGPVAVLLKGLAFASELYPDPAARCAGDIDLMVDVDAKEQVRQCFQRAGIEELAHGARPPGRIRSGLRWITSQWRWQRTPQSPGAIADEGETIFRTRVGDHDVLIEIHYHLINLRAGGGKERVFRARSEGAPNLRPLQLAAGEVCVLEHADAFLHALRHIALHHRLIGFRWHHDLALMLVQWAKHLKPHEIRARCQALNSEKILRVELAILRELFGARIFPDGAGRQWEFSPLPWEYPLYRHVARGGKRTPWRELVRTLLAPSLNEQLQTLS